MHLLQWMQSDSYVGVRLHALHEIGLAEQRAGHLHEREAVGERALDRLEPVDAAEQDERHRERGAELARVRQEVRLLERVLAGRSGRRTA